MFISPPRYTSHNAFKVFCWSSDSINILNILLIAPSFFYLHFIFPSVAFISSKL